MDVKRFVETITGQRDKRTTLPQLVEYPLSGGRGYDIHAWQADLLTWTAPVEEWNEADEEDAER